MYENSESVGQGWKRSGLKREEITLTTKRESFVLASLDGRPGLAFRFSWSYRCGRGERGGTKAIGNEIGLARPWDSARRSSWSIVNAGTFSPGLQAPMPIFLVSDKGRSQRHHHGTESLTPYLFRSFSERTGPSGWTRGRAQAVRPELIIHVGPECD